MDKFDDYYKEIKNAAIEYWKKDSYDTFKDAGDDPVVNLFLSAFAYQAFGIQRNIEDFETKAIRDFRDQILPFSMTKPIPAFSVIRTALTKSAGSENNAKMVDESCFFEFIKGKHKFNFSPLLKTKVINAKLKIQEKTDRLFLVDICPLSAITDLSGVSFYFSCDEFVDIEISYNGKQLPLIKPTQYNELPFTKWFNNNHLFIRENYHLFGNYDFWQEVFLVGNTQLFYIDSYNPKEFVFEKDRDIRLEIFFKNKIDPERCNVEINCIPVVNVERKEATFTSSKPIQELTAKDGEFLNLLYCDDFESTTDLQEYFGSFLIRKFGIERYNTRELLRQLHDLSTRYVSDYYAFQHIDNIKDDSNSDKINKIMKELDNLREIVEKTNEVVLKDKNKVNNNYYAILRQNSKLSSKAEHVYLQYLCTSGSLPNGIKKNEKAARTSLGFDKNQTILLQDIEGGKDSISDEVKKENMTHYYLLTKDRLVTMADIRAFCHKEMEGYAEKIDILKKDGVIKVTIKLDEDFLFQNKDKLESWAHALRKKIELRSSGILPYQVYFK